MCQKIEMFDLFFGWAWCENRARNSGMRARDVMRTAEEEKAKIVPESRKLEVGSA